MQPPKPYTARLEDKIAFNDKFIQYNFELEEPHTLEFTAGQYVSVQVDERGDRRNYSMSSSPAITHGIELLLDIEPQGLGSQYFSSLEPGDRIKFLAPMGVFKVEENPAEKSLVFVATGSGIAPFRSMILDLLQVKRDPRPITLHWGMRYDYNLFWLDEFQELVEAFSNFSFQPVISRPHPEWNLSRGRVTNVLETIDLPAEAGYYLCGGKPMIEDVVRILANKGVTRDMVHYEKFF